MGEKIKGYEEECCKKNMRIDQLISQKEQVVHEKEMLARIHRQKLKNIYLQIQDLLKTQKHNTVAFPCEQANNSYCAEAGKVMPLITYSNKKRKKTRGKSNGHLFVQVKPPSGKEPMLQGENVIDGDKENQSLNELQAGTHEEEDTARFKKLS